MTSQQWKSRCVGRIDKAVKKAGYIRIRALKRATHYERGPDDESVSLWYEALDMLVRLKRIVAEVDEDGLEVALMTPAVARGRSGVTTPSKSTESIESTT